MKKTWDIIKQITNRMTTKKQLPSFFNLNGQIITGKHDIANKFNEYFTKIGPNAAPTESRDVKRTCGTTFPVRPELLFREESCKLPARRFTYHSDGMADARLFEMLDSIAIQVSPHSYRPVIESMFYDDVVNGGRLYTLRCFTAVIMIKYPWGKDYIRFEYKKFMKRLTSDRRRRHPRRVSSTDLPAYHRCYSPPPPPPSDGVVRFVSPPASPTPTSGGFHHRLHHYHSTTSPTRYQTTD